MFHNFSPEIHPLKLRSMYIKWWYRTLGHEARGANRGEPFHACLISSWWCYNYMSNKSTQLGVIFYLIHAKIRRAREREREVRLKDRNFKKWRKKNRKLKERKHKERENEKQIIKCTQHSIFSKFIDVTFYF